MLNGFDHVVVAVDDLEQATSNYRTLLGREPSWRGCHPEAGTENTLFRVANMYLELLMPIANAEASTTGARVREAIDRDGEGLLALSFSTDDADAFRDAVRDKGLTATDPIPGEGRNDAGDSARKWRNVMLHPDSTRSIQLFAIEHLSPEDTLPIAAPIGAENGCVSALDHVVVLTGDIDATGAIYGDALGLRLALDRSFEARGLRMKFFRVGGVTIEVVGRLDDADRSAEPDRFGGLAYQIPNVAAAHARLSEAGFDLTDVRDGNKAGTRVCTVRDGTCGVATLLIEPVGR